MSLINGTVLPTTDRASELQEVILLTNGTGCCMQALDFDEDGDVDLLLGNTKYKPSRYSRYFERISAKELVERKGQANPLEVFDGKAECIADVDGDGRLDVLTRESYSTYWSVTAGFRYFRRASDGSFVEPAENPFAGIALRQEEAFQSLYVADWTSDGLPDVLAVAWSGAIFWSVQKVFQQVSDRRMARNTQMDTYEDIKNSHYDRLIVVDWNGDGFEDVVVLEHRKADIQGFMYSKHLRLHEFDGRRLREVVGVFDNVTRSLQDNYSARAAMMDWDQDGDLDLIVLSETDGKLHYHEMISGSLQSEASQHPFQNISLRKTTGITPLPYKLVEPMVVDFDNDGDMDLILGPPDGRYFQQLADGSLQEWPLAQSPIRSVESIGGFGKFLDCDGDGDFDMLRGNLGLVQACEHDGEHKLQCDDDFLCLGTNLSQLKELPPTAGFFQLGLGNLADGLKFISMGRSHTVESWSAGLCVPVEPCYRKGICSPRQTHCSCVAGHELGDCSGCEPHFYSVSKAAGMAHDCAACPGTGGHVCYGRGECFDDIAAKASQNESTGALMAMGNGSCSCNEAYFHGRDEDGRDTCVEGNCPAGTEENNGGCASCAAGSYSQAGGRCKPCEKGKYSHLRNSNCSVCLPGTVSKTSGSSACDACPAGTREVDNQFCSECPSGKISGPASQNCSACPAGSVSKSPGSWSCDACPAGKYEVNNQLCSNCPVGTISGSGNNTCTRCQAGFQAPKPGSVACQPCPAGTYAVEASAKCSVCPPGSISGVASGACSQCNAGHFAKAALSCEPCPAGTSAGRGSSVCQGCPLGRVASPSSAACRSCEGLLIQMTPDATNQTCEVVAMHIVFALISWATSACIVLLVLIGCFSRLPIADVSAQGQKVVVTTSMPHYLLKWACPVAIFTSTGVPDLESSSRTWRVKPLSAYQMTLHGDDSTMQLETSTGHVQISFPYLFVSAGIWRCPLTLWCLLFFAAAAGTASQLTWSLALVVSGSSLCTGALCFALRRRWGDASSVSVLPCISWSRCPRSFKSG